MIVKLQQTEIHRQGGQQYSLMIQVLSYESQYV